MLPFARLRCAPLWGRCVLGSVSHPARTEPTSPPAGLGGPRPRASAHQGRSALKGEEGLALRASVRRNSQHRTPAAPLPLFPALAGTRAIARRRGRHWPRNRRRGLGSGQGTLGLGPSFAGIPARRRGLFGAARLAAFAAHLPHGFSEFFGVHRGRKCQALGMCQRRSWRTQRPTGSNRVPYDSVCADMGYR